MLGPVLQYLYFCRFPLLVALLLAGLAPLALWGAPSLLANLFALGFWRLVLVTGLAFFAAWVVLIALELILALGPQRFGVPAPPLPGWLRRLRVPLFGLLALPIAAAAVLGSPGSLAKRLLATALGVLFAVGLLLLAGTLHAALRVQGTTPSDVIPLASRLSFVPALRRGPARPPAPAPAAGYRSPRHRGVAAGHLVAAAFFAITVAVYALFYFLGRPDGGGIEPPTLAYVLLLLLLAAWGLPGLSFALDRYRVPVLLLVVGASFLSSQACDTDHYYRIERLRERRAAGPAPGELPSSAEAYAAAEAERPMPRRPIVVVAASGGGITAALWTARVLTALQAEVGNDFASAIRLISAVSGGSTGTIYYLDGFRPEGPPTPEGLREAVKAAGTSSLDAVGWGLAYPDFWRGFAGFLLWDETQDRGWALERSWRRRLSAGKRDWRLSDWAAAVEAGWLPPAVLNSTTVESGERFLLSPIGVKRFSSARRFDLTYPGYDLPIVTAARLSATFPWVSPVTRALRSDTGEAAAPAFHLADGGYYDNFGVVTVVDWLLSLEDRERQELAGRGIVLVLVRAFPPGREVLPDPRENNGWLTATLGPILTLLNVRTSGQEFRNGRDLQLLRKLSGFEDIPLHEVPFILRERSPLSWKLTPAEGCRILDGWCDARNRRGLQQVRRLFAPGAPPPAAAETCEAEAERLCREIAW